MQVLFLFFSYFFHSSHILIWGLNLWTILSIMLQPISKKSFILSAQRLSPAFLVAAFLGTLNHFLYFLSGQSPIVALFCPVNESVWEHLKLLYFPFLFVSIWEYLSLHPVVLPFFYCRYLGVLLGMFFTVSVFYTYSGILGRNFLILDILLFYSSVIFSFGMSEYISGKTRSPHETEPGFVVSLWLITSFFFFVFTCFPPDLPLFYSA